MATGTGLLICATLLTACADDPGCAFAVKAGDYRVHDGGLWQSDVRLPGVTTPVATPWPAPAAGDPGPRPRRRAPPPRRPRWAAPRSRFGSPETVVGQASEDDLVGEAAIDPDRLTQPTVLAEPERGSDGDHRRVVGERLHME